MVIEGMYRRGGPVQAGPMAESRRGRHWNPPYQRPPPPRDSRPCPPRQGTRDTRLYGAHRGGVPVPSVAAMQQMYHAPARAETSQPSGQAKFAALPQKQHANSARPQFHHLYQEFENMKRKGFVLGANNTGHCDRNEESKSQQSNARDQAVKTLRAPGKDNFADAMQIFMRSYFPMSSFSCAKPVEDWSKEAGNLLQELTDKESQSDLDNSIWNIPSSESGSRRPSRSEGFDACENSVIAPCTKTPQKDAVTSRENAAGFDIYRHIMQINPSPYPGGSPVSTGQSASNHSSDNDADDEDTHSSVEYNSCKAIGAKKSLKKRLNSSSSCPTMDSGYLSSANESDGSRSKYPPIPGCASNDSDEVGSENGFTSSTCSSWPTSPLQRFLSGPHKHHDQRGPSGRRHSSQGSGSNGQQLAQNEYAEMLNSLSQLKKPLGIMCPPVPPPLPPFLSGLPIPPPPHFLTPPFHAAGFVSGMQPPMSRLPPPPPPVSGFALISPQIPPHHLQQQFSVPQVRTSPQPSGNPDQSDAAQDMGPNNVYHKHKAWITDEILEMIAVRDRLYKRMKKHPAPDIVEMYKKVRNMVVGMTRNAKRAYEKQFEEQQLANPPQLDVLTLGNFLPLPIQPNQNYGSAW